MRFSDNIERLAYQIIHSAGREGKKLAVAESCTGGLIAAALTSISGASKVFERGFVSYSNDAKIDLLGVLPENLGKYGAVSPEIAEEMANGALSYSHADIALAVTGIAGPTGGTEAKPVGYVCFGVATKAGTCFHATMHFRGDRNSIRQQSTEQALTLMLSVLEEKA